MSYLEQSTRYLGYDRRLPNGLYRFYRDSDILDSRFGARYIGEMDRMFDTYRELLPELTDWLTAAAFPRPPRTPTSSIARPFAPRPWTDCAGLLPASALSNLGIYASGQAYESLLLRMRAHPLPEVREYAELMLDELVKVIPSFLRRLDVPERGRAWTHVPCAILARATRALLDDDANVAEDEEGVRLVAFDPEGESRVLEAIVFANSNVSHDVAARRVAAMTSDERRALLATYVGRARKPSTPAGARL